jgi:hypothetical protein
VHALIGASLDADLPKPERAKWQNTFLVYGRGQFPMDMLRSDECWPCDTESVAAIGDSLIGEPKNWRVKLASARREPTVGRWQSFRCTVESII